MEQKIELTAERKELFSLSHGIALSAKVYGELEREKFELALHKTFLKYPVLTGRICFSDTGERLLTAADDRKITPLYYPYAEVTYIEKHIEKEERIPFELEKGPLCKVLVFLGEGRSVFLLIASSLLVDGSSLQTVMESIIYYLNHEEEEPEKPESIVSWKHLSTDVKLRLGELFKINRINRMWKKKSHEFSKEEYWYHYGRYHKEHKTPVLIKEIYSRSTSSLLKNCEERDVHVEAALLTAFLAVMNTFDRTHTGKEIPIHCGIDLRQAVIIKSASKVGKFDALCTLKKQYTQGLSFWDNVKMTDEYLTQRFQNKKQTLKSLLLSQKLDGLLLESLPFQAYGGFDTEAGKLALELFGEDNRERGVGLYSIKEVDYDQKEAFTIDSLDLIPPASLYNDLTIGAIIVNGKLRLCIRYDKSHYSEHLVEDMVRAAVNYMWNRSENKQIRKPLAF